jgi:CRISPR-associated protein Csm2
MYNNSGFSGGSHVNNNGRGGNFHNGNMNQYQPNLQVKDNTGKILTFNPEWITKEADKAMVAYTEAAGKQMAEGEGKLSTSRIRNIFGEIKRIQVSGFEKEKSSFYLLSPKVAYAVGRERNSANGNLMKIEGILLFQDIFKKASEQVTDTKSYQNFCNFMEALVAYHKAFGGDK